MVPLLTAAYFLPLPFVVLLTPRFFQLLTRWIVPVLRLTKCRWQEPRGSCCSCHSGSRLKATYVLYRSYRPSGDLFKNLHGLQCLCRSCSCRAVAVLPLRSTVPCNFVAVTSDTMTSTRATLSLAASPHQAPYARATCTNLRKKHILTQTSASFRQTI